MVDAGVTRFVWLRQFEPGSNSADVNRLLDGLEHVRWLAIPEGFFCDIPATSDYAVAPAGGALLRRGAPRAPGQPTPRDSRGLRRRVGDVSRRRGGGDPRLNRRQNVSRSRPYLRSAARGRDGRGPRGARGIRPAGAGADRRAGHRGGARLGDRGQSRMGRSRRPCRQGGRGQGDPVVPAEVSAWRHQSIVIASVAGRRGGVPSAGCCSVTGRFSPNRPCSPFGASRPSRYRRVTSRCQAESHTTT